MPADEPPEASVEPCRLATADGAGTTNAAVARMAAAEARQARPTDVGGGKSAAVAKSRRAVCDAPGACLAVWTLRRSRIQSNGASDPRGTKARLSPCAGMRPRALIENPTTCLDCCSIALARVPGPFA